MNILLVEDEIDFRQVLAEYLSISGFNVFEANHGKIAIEIYEKEHIDIAILDIMMPVMDGFITARKLRSMNPNLPLIFLTAKNQREDRLKGLKLGADDYITKPFEAEELVLRIQNILRRTGGKPGENQYIGSLELKMDELRLISGKKAYQLTIREAELLALLGKKRNLVVSRDEILKDLWDQNDYFTGRSMDVFISRIRKYLDDDPSLSLETIRGIGYILREAEPN